MVSKIKIVCSVTNDLAQDRRMHRICQSLTTAGYDVTLVGRQKKVSQPLMHFPFHTHRLQLAHEKGPLFYKNYNDELTQYLLAEKPDIIYAVDTDTLLGAGRAVSKLGVKFVYDAHEYFTEVPELIGKPIRKAVWRAIEKKYIPKTDLRFTVAEELAAILGNVHGQAFHVVRNTPMAAQVEDLKTKNGKVILYQGVLNKGRGLEQMITAMDLLEDDSIQLKLVGGGDLEKDLRIQAEESKSQDRIHFAGWQTGAELDASTREAWLGINLLDAQSLNYKYSLANKFFDYMHAGVPSLNMDLPEYKKIISLHKVGMLLTDLSPQDIAACINRLDEQSHSAMTTEALKASKIYTWKVDEEVLLSQMGRLI